MWKKFDATQIRGSAVIGDPSAPKTRWWLLPLLLVVWKKRAVFSVSGLDAMAGYRIGYKPADGPARLNDAIVHQPRFQVRIGREDCTFFAIGPRGYEVPMNLIAEKDKDDPSLKPYPLY